MLTRIEKSARTRSTTKFVWPAFFAGSVLSELDIINLFKQLKGSVKEPNMFHNYETEKITRKASDAAESLQL